MVTQRRSGWYDDPHDENLLRYWDGVVWTEHVANKRPVQPPSSITEPAGSATAQQWSQYQAQQGGFGDSRRSFDRPGGGGHAGDGRTQFSGWWRRAGAMIVDLILVGLVCTPFTLWRLSGSMGQLEAWQAQVMQALSSGATLPEPPAQALLHVGTVTLVQTLVYVLLDAFFLSRTGVTPGRRLTGIRVRPVGVDAPVQFAAGLRRSMIKNVANILSGVPFLSLFAFGFQVADYLWPLRDPGRQSWHDKACGTEVVRGRPLRGPQQEPRNGPEAGSPR